MNKRLSARLKNPRFWVALPYMIIFALPLLFIIKLTEWLSICFCEVSERLADLSDWIDLETAKHLKAKQVGDWVEKADKSQTGEA